MKRVLTIIVALAIAATLSVNVFAEETDAVLYYMVDCGDRSLNTVSEGDTLGIYQSVTEQIYGADPATGKVWGIVDGLRESDEDAALRTTWTNVVGNDGDPMEATGRWTQDMKQNGIDRVVTYKFEIPNGTYEVEVGLMDLWDCAYLASVEVDGGDAWDSGEGYKGSTATATLTAEVTDGELDVVITAGEVDGEQIDMVVVTYITVTGESEASAPSETPDSPSNAPQTGFATAAMAVLAAVAAGYVVSKKH